MQVRSGQSIRGLAATGEPAPEEIGGTSVGNGAASSVLVVLRSLTAVIWVSLWGRACSQWDASAWLMIPVNQSIRGLPVTDEPGPEEIGGASVGKGAASGVFVVLRSFTVVIWLSLWGARSQWDPSAASMIPVHRVCLSLRARGQSWPVR